MARKKPPTDELTLTRAALLDPLARFALADWLEERERTDEATVIREATGFVRRVEMDAAFDRRHHDPDKNYSIGGARLRMVLIGPSGAVDFILDTNWQLTHVAREVDWLPPMAIRVGVHSKKPQHEAHKPRDCPYLPCPCYYDSSALAAELLFEILLREGDEGVWKHLRERYRESFGG